MRVIALVIALVAAFVAGALAGALAVMLLSPAEPKSWRDETDEAGA